MKYFAIVFLLFASYFFEISGIRVDKLTGEEGQSAEADLDSLMDKYDDKEKADKDKKLKKKTSSAQASDPN